MRPCARSERDEELRATGVARFHGLAVATGVAGDPTDGHVDTEARGGALLLRLATPEPVLAVFTGPVPAVDEGGAAPAHRAGLGLAGGAGLGAFPGRREEQPRLAAAGCLVGPPERTGEHEACRDRFGCHQRPLSKSSADERSGASTTTSRRLSPGARGGSRLTGLCRRIDLVNLITRLS